VDGSAVRTVEGLAPAGIRATAAGVAATLDPLQAAFLETGGAQCGICTPGFVMALFALYQEPGQPDRNRIDDALAGNLCRCTGYQNIVKAVLDAAETSKGVPA